jgi:hypothetical protein
MRKTFGIWLAFAAVIHAAGLDFAEISKEIHAPADVTTVTADFEFTNKSGLPVTITKSDPGCSCVAVQVSGGKFRYETGESGMIRATFDMTNFSGTVDKVIALWLDKDPVDKPSTLLKLKVNIPVLVAMEPKTLKWELGGKGEPQTIQITMLEGQKINVTSVQSSSDSFICELKPVEPGKHYELIVTPTNVGVAGIGVFRIETDCQIKKHRTQQAFAVVRKPTAAETAAKP